MENLLGMLGVKECTSDFNKEFLLKDNDNFSDEEMKEMENLSFEQVVERIIEVVWENSPKLNDFPKNDKEVLQKITIGFQRTEYNSNMLKRKSDFDGIEEYLYIMTEDGKININDDFLKYFNVPFFLTSVSFLASL